MGHEANCPGCRRRQIVRRDTSAFIIPYLAGTPIYGSTVSEPLDADAMLLLVRVAAMDMASYGQVVQGSPWRNDAPQASPRRCDARTATDWLIHDSAGTPRSSSVATPIKSTRRS